jgi:uncharacterized protein YdeI (YjbR/CyaY-like superfamily)
LRSFATPDCSTRIWRTGLEALRCICLDAGLQESVKWSHPCYMHAGRNIAIIGALRGDFRLSFFDAALMTDPEGILEYQGPNIRHADMIRFKDSGDVARLEPAMRTYLAEAMGYAAAGIRPPSDPQARDLPVELVAAMDADPKLAEAFHALTTGRRNSYVTLLNSAKKPSTRIARIAQLRARIFAGKGAAER